jgi:hypothetical protein
MNRDSFLNDENWDPNVIPTPEQIGRQVKRVRTALVQTEFTDQPVFRDGDIGARVVQVTSMAMCSLMDNPYSQQGAMVAAVVAGISQNQMGRSVVQSPKG